jgi:hypothetical protein
MDNSKIRQDRAHDNERKPGGFEMISTVMVRMLANKELPAVLEKILRQEVDEAA